MLYIIRGDVKVLVWVQNLEKENVVLYLQYCCVYIFKVIKNYCQHLHMAANSYNCGHLDFDLELLRIKDAQPDKKNIILTASKVGDILCCFEICSVAFLHVPLGDN